MSERFQCPTGCENALNDWLLAAAIDRGKLFRKVNKVGRAWGDGITEKAVWHIVKESAKAVGIAKLAPHDLRRTCARLCHASGGELEQIQFLLGHISVQTTERYLGCKQRIRSAVNDRIGIESRRFDGLCSWGRRADNPSARRSMSVHCPVPNS
jgi:site-specific recombinase XerD